jgi:hypothetical protein
MACDVLRANKSSPFFQTVQHDLESFFYVLIWICVRYCGPNNAVRHFPPAVVRPDGWAARNPLDDWFAEDLQVVANSKCSQMMISFESTLDWVDPYFEDLVVCIRRFRDVLFDEATMPAKDVFACSKSTATYEKVIAALQESLADLPEIEKSRDQILKDTDSSLKSVEWGQLNGPTQRALLKPTPQNRGPSDMGDSANLRRSPRLMEKAQSSPPLTQGLTDLSLDTTGLGKGKHRAM